MNKDEVLSELNKIRNEKEKNFQKILYYRRKIDHLTSSGTSYVVKEGEMEKRLKYWKIIEELNKKDKEFDLLTSKIRQEFLSSKTKDFWET